MDTTPKPNSSDESVVHATTSNALVQHTLSFYRELYKLSTYDEELQCHLFEGNLTTVYNGLGISTALYSRIRRILMDSSSIEMLERGNIHKKTLVALLREPDDEDFTLERLTKPATSAILVAQLQKRVAALEGLIGAITNQGTLSVPNVLRDHERRILDLEVERSNRREQGLTDHPQV